MLLLLLHAGRPFDCRLPQYIVPYFTTISFRNVLFLSKLQTLLSFILKALILLYSLLFVVHSANTALLRTMKSHSHFQLAIKEGRIQVSILNSEQSIGQFSTLYPNKARKDISEPRPWLSAPSRMPKSLCAIRNGGHQNTCDRGAPRPSAEIICHSSPDASIAAHSPESRLRPNPYEPAEHVCQRCSATLS